jgi:hypothetical protein
MSKVRFRSKPHRRSGGKRGWHDSDGPNHTLSGAQPEVDEKLPHTAAAAADGQGVGSSEGPAAAAAATAAAATAATAAVEVQLPRPGPTKPLQHIPPEAYAYLSDLSCGEVRVAQIQICIMEKRVPGEYFRVAHALALDAAAAAAAGPPGVEALAGTEAGTEMVSTASAVMAVVDGYAAGAGSSAGR